MSKQLTSNAEKKILSKLLVTRFDFIWANGRGFGYGKNYRIAARHLITKCKEIKVGLLVEVIPHIKNSKVGYWDSRQFLKELKKGKLIEQYACTCDNPTTTICGDECDCGGVYA